MSDKITVFSFKRCPFAMRVRMALFEKGLDFQIKEEDLKNFSPQLKELHPEGKVPLLVHGTRIIYESSIITEYIDETFPGNISLMPIKSEERAEVRLWTYWCNQILKPDVDRFKYGISRFLDAECIGIEKKLLTHLQKMEDRLKSYEWLVGDHFSLADIHVFPFCRQLSRIAPTPHFLTSYPWLIKWIDRMSARSSFKKTMEI